MCTDENNQFFLWSFPDDVQSGLLEVVSPSPHYYPDFSTIKESLGDSKDRVRWRTKQNLDFSYLMHYAQDKGSYYIQLEDDVIAKSGYYDEIKAFTAQEASKDWLFLEFSQLGFIERRGEERRGEERRGEERRGGKIIADF
ncbi:Alpha-1,3-mannosyl-glycoprotein 4-beta-N-acetylglucosaminyltransferase B [Takifugu flavidus]|uniref:Alpha-1,3-mannosyl-glycoprotein 4-beta-N-acetylglucosaminyltransferase B n=1 Tax=Takifugu flavidus TaxID=433684 RepID=A0A5C6MR33_9TELE|nr:Alpha-1,3-mannosyl-glycoprotein 4-beta-N-acetylglucosaminyltransferase B [Takifugu flavidus]